MWGAGATDTGDSISFIHASVGRSRLMLPFEASQSRDMEIDSIKKKSALEAFIDREFFIRNLS